jgi:hypothetical protein
MFEIGVMKVKLVCIDNYERHNYLTLHGIYEGWTQPSGYGKKNYYVEGEDDGKSRWELKKRFILLDEWRDRQLNQIFDD